MTVALLVNLEQSGLTNPAGRLLTHRHGELASIGVSVSPEPRWL